MKLTKCFWKGKNLRRTFLPSCIALPAACSRSTMRRTWRPERDGHSLYQALFAGSLGRGCSLVLSWRSRATLCCLNPLSCNLLPSNLMPSNLPQAWFLRQCGLGAGLGPHHHGGIWNIDRCQPIFCWSTWRVGELAKLFRALGAGRPLALCWLCGLWTPLVGGGTTPASYMHYKALYGPLQHPDLRAAYNWSRGA